MDPANASVFDVPGQGLLRKVVGLLGLDDPNQVMGVAGTPLETGANTGGLVDALAQRFPRFAQAIKAYHGSPHDFEQFDVSKIGSGEGAQAYGHGLYFAENEGTAKSYRDALAPLDVTVRGVPGVKWENPVPGMRAVTKGSLDTARASGKFTADELDAMAHMNDSSIDASIKNLREQAAMDWRGPSAQKLWAQRADILEKLKAETEIKPSGRMYEVAIKAHPDQFLDWDKPLKEQSDTVREGVLKAYGDIRPVKRPDGSYSITSVDPNGSGRMLDYGFREATPDAAINKFKEAVFNQPGSMAYREIANPQAASNAMRDAGIPGIKYLDQGSRAAGEGTRNFVVFDDKTVEILKKYGLLLPASGAALSAKPQQEQ
jgi:hypothetical protein